MRVKIDLKKAQNESGAVGVRADRCGTSSVIGEVRASVVFGDLLENEPRSETRSLRLRLRRRRTPPDQKDTGDGEIPFWSTSNRLFSLSLKEEATIRVPRVFGFPEEYKHFVNPTPPDLDNMDLDSSTRI
ncbi:hypothetical protein F2Q70_00004935 [Brassica cretica]|uniref:Uncharacterized protein n=1 Tax=Brassica cretica TaxID=69181 RepID=A0A8S9IW14_BRACR|nr:hypothetical protein F2Q70_00004935 [Brassica cretica]